MSSSVFTGHVGMGYVRQDAEHEPPSKPVGSTPPWSLLQFLPQVPPFLPHAVFITALGNKLEEHAHNLQTDENADGSSTAEYSS